MCVWVRNCCAVVMPPRADQHVGRQSHPVAGELPAGRNRQRDPFGKVGKTLGHELTRPSHSHPAPFLQTWQSTILVVSHDRNFLNAVVTDIIHLHSQRLDSYRGDYENFIKTKEDRLKNQQREYEAQQQYRQHIQVP